MSSDREDQPESDRAGAHAFYGLAGLAQKLFNVPLFLRPEKAELLVAVLAEKLGVAGSARVGGKALPVDRGLARRSGTSASLHQMPSYEALHGLAVIDIHGTLVHRTWGMHPESGMCGYDAIRFNFYAAMDDPEIRGICLSIDSPGGEASGCLELAEAIRGMRGEKPCWAVVTDCAYSGAYAIASAADRVVLPRTGEVGSLSPILVYVDWEQALSHASIPVSFFRYGQQASDERPDRDLRPEVRQQFQSRLDDAGDLLVQTVARNRSLAVDAVREMIGACYRGDEARALGLVDAVIPPDAAFRSMLASVS